MRMKIFSAFRVLSVYLLLLAISTGCSSKKEDNNLWWLWLLGVNGSNHELYYYIPGATNNENFQPASASLKGNRKKIVFIHGWNPSERSSDPVTTNSQKIANILLTWEDAIGYYNQNTASSYTNYEIYFFTYRTSDAVADNGQRLIDKLNEVFTAADNVTIVAHSMGGLVSKSAMYHSDNTNDIIDYLVTLGTPYYGSPFSSDAYLMDLGSMGDIISYLTNTTGGLDLAWTNTGMSIIINGAVNSFLDILNGNTDRNTRIFPYAGVLASCADSQNQLYHEIGCTIMQNGTPAFTNNDGIVPQDSASMAGHVNSVLKTGFDHDMLTFRIPTDTIMATLFYTEVIAKIDSFTF